MARIEEHLRFTIQIGDDKNPVLILRNPTSSETKAFLKGRFERRGRKIDDRSVESRERFINDLLVGCENIEVKDGDNWVSLIPSMPGWEEKIPLNWKTSVAVQFEEQEIVSEEMGKN